MYVFAVQLFWVIHPAKCHMSDSAVCRNWRGRIPAAGTLCVRGGEGGGTEDSHSAGREHWLHSSAGCPPPWSVHTETRRWELCHRPATKTCEDTHTRETKWSQHCKPQSEQTNPCIIFVFVSLSPAMHIMVPCSAAYLCLQFSWGTEFKEELHHIMVSLLGGEEQGSRTSLEGKLKKDPADVISLEQRWKHSLT